MKKRQHFESMKLDQLENELRQLDEVKGRLHREQKTYKKWIQEILTNKRQRVAAEQEKERQAELESLPDKINEQHTHEWALFMETMIAERNARLAARTDDDAKNHAPWRTDNIMWLTQADMQAGMPEKFAEKGDQVFVLADESNFRRVKDVISDGMLLATTKYLKGKNYEPIPIIKDVAMNNEWKKVVLGGAMSAIDYAALIKKGGLQDQMKQAFDHAHITALLGEEDMMEPFKPVAAAALAKQGIRTTQQLFEAANMPHVWAALERELDQFITLSPPRSAEEAYLRVSVQYQLLAHAAQNTGNQQVASLHDKLAERRMARIPKRTTIDPMNIPDVLRDVPRDFFASGGIVTALESGKHVFLCRKSDFDMAPHSKALATHLTNDPLVTRERIAAVFADAPLDPANTEEWVSGTFPVSKPKEVLTEAFANHKQWGATLLEDLAGDSSNLPEAKQVTIDALVILAANANWIDFEKGTRWASSQTAAVFLPNTKAFPVYSASPATFAKNISDFKPRDKRNAELGGYSLMHLTIGQDVKLQPILLERTPFSKFWSGAQFARTMMDSTFSSKHLKMGQLSPDHDHHRQHVANKGVSALLAMKYGFDMERWAQEACARIDLRQKSDLLKLMANDEVWRLLENSFDSNGSFAPPASPEEAYVRTSFLVSSLHDALSDSRIDAPSQALLHATERASSKRLGRVPQRVTIDPANVPPELAHLDPAVFSTPGLIVAKEADSYVFLMKRDAFHATPDTRLLAAGLTDHSLTTRERLAALLPDEPHDETAATEWESGYVPTPENIALNGLHREFDAEFSRMETKALALDFTPEEAAVFAQITASIRSLQWHDGKREVMDTAKIGVRFETKEQQGDAYLGTGPQRELLLRRDARHPAWLMRDVIDLLPVDGKSQDAVWKISAGLINKLYPVQVIPAYEAGSKHTEFIQKVVGATRAVTREYPRGTEEAGRRIAYSSHSWESANAMKQLFVDMKPTAIADQEHAWLREHLEMLDPTLLAPNPNLTYTLQWGASKAQFVCRKENVPAQFMNYLDTDVDETLDLVVNLGLQDEHALENDAWVSGTLPSIEELERELFAQDFVPEKFFPNNKEPLSPVPEGEIAAGVGAEGSGNEPKPIPRLKALRNTLLKNRWKAHFTVDDRTATPSVAQYAAAEPGHYVLVSLPEAKLQVLISDDHSKGTFIIRNLIDPAEFTRISIDEFLAGYGATRVKWDSPEQFRKGLETEIGEQIRDPITIYPVASSYPTPLDSYPNIEAQKALLRDFGLAAAQAGKASIDDLTVADFSRIKSGLVRWSFGGVAGGAAYLDRVASEFGLDANVLNDRNAHELRQLDAKAAQQPQWSKDGELYQRELARLQEITNDPVEQYEYRERILRTILWDLSETYRATRTSMYAEKAKHGRWHSVTVRKSRNGNGNHASGPEEQTVQ